jgi:hypothetical protein
MYCVRGLSGPQADDAWHRLVEAGPGVIPSIVRTLGAEMQPRIQAELVRALASYRSSEAISALSELVISRESEVWKLALDALVTVGGDEARKALQQASHLANCARGGKAAASLLSKNAESIRSSTARRSSGEKPPSATLPRA